MKLMYYAFASSLIDIYSSSALCREVNFVVNACENVGHAY
jgi:hypothetical protein